MTAARIAGLALVLGSGAAYAMDPATGARETAGAERAAEQMRVSAGGCCTFPMWGPPAPPVMTPELVS